MSARVGCMRNDRGSFHTAELQETLISSYSPNLCVAAAEFATPVFAFKKHSSAQRPLPPLGLARTVVLVADSIFFSLLPKKKKKKTT